MIRLPAHPLATQIAIDTLKAGVPGVLQVESGAPREVREALESRGHVVEDGDGGFGGSRNAQGQRGAGLLSRTASSRVQAAPRTMAASR